MLFIGALIGFAVGVVKVVAGSAIRTGLGAVALGSRVGYSAYLNTVRAAVLLGRGVAQIGASLGGAGGAASPTYTGSSAAERFRNNRDFSYSYKPDLEYEPVYQSELDAGVEVVVPRIGADLSIQTLDELQSKTPNLRDTPLDGSRALGSTIPRSLTGRVVSRPVVFSKYNPAIALPKSLGNIIYERRSNVLVQDGMMSGVMDSSNVLTIPTEITILAYDEQTGFVKYLIDDENGRNELIVAFEEVRKQYVEEKKVEWENSPWIKGTGGVSATQLELLERNSSFIVKHAIKRAIAERKIGWRSWVPIYGAYLKYREGKSVNDAILQDEGLIGGALDGILSLLDVYVLYKAMGRLAQISASLLRKSNTLVKAELVLSRKNSYRKYFSKFTNGWRNHSYGEFNTEIIKSKSGFWETEELISQGAHNPNGLNKTFRVKQGTFTKPNPPVSDKPFKAVIEVRYKSGEWIEKEVETNIFPYNWSEQRIKEEIAYVYENTVAKGVNLRRAKINGNKEFVGQSTAGFDILIEVDRFGNIINAYPI